MDNIKVKIDKYIQDQEYTKAIDELTDYIERDIDVINCFMLRGDVYYIKQEFAKALNDFNKVLKIDPENKSLNAKVEMIKDILKFQALDIYSSTNLNKDPWLDD
ncbi:MAG TPA: hypothetical protein DCG75_06420 [Bacteroidales bacterium]|jgi:tetratricopeptide (TPR) repeat protein|nr:hypothetical protein [Bacteroidales bacterium]